MSNFINNFNKLISKNWNSPEEEEIVDYFRVNNKKITGDESMGQQFIDDFIIQNQYMFELTSEEFKNNVNSLDSDFLQEAEDGYHGFWEETALKIHNKSKNPNSHAPLTIDQVKRIKAIAKEYGTMIQAPDAPQDHLILPRILIGQIGEFESDIRGVSKNLKVSIHQTNRDFNIADKINNGTISENKHKMNKNIKVGLKNWNIKVEGNKIIVTEGKNVHRPFIQSNGQVIWDAPHTIPYVIKESIADLSLEMIQENNTSDISIPEIPATNSEALARVSRFDPYGNAQNKVSGSKSEVKIGDKFDKLTFKESVSKLDKSKVFVIDHDLTEDTGMYSNILIEHKTKQQHIVIDKKDFSLFVKRNCLIENYIKKDVFDFNAYINSRSKGMVNTIIKEYFDNQNNAENNLKIDSVKRENGQISINYYFEQEVDGKNVIVPEEEFFIYCQNADPTAEEYAFPQEDGNDDHPMGMGMYFDEDMYYQHGDIYGMAKGFIQSKLKK